MSRWTSRPRGRRPTRFEGWTTSLLTLDQDPFWRNMEAHRMARNVTTFLQGAVEVLLRISVSVHFNLLPCFGQQNLVLIHSYFREMGMQRDKQAQTDRSNLLIIKFLTSTVAAGPASGPIPMSLNVPLQLPRRPCLTRLATGGVPAPVRERPDWIANPCKSHQRKVKAPLELGTWRAHELALPWGDRCCGMF